MCIRICVLQCITFKIRRILIADRIILVRLLMIDVDQIEKNDDRDRRRRRFARKAASLREEGSIDRHDRVFASGTFAT